MAAIRGAVVALPWFGAGGPPHELVYFAIDATAKQFAAAELATRRDEPPPDEPTIVEAQR